MNDEKLQFIGLSFVGRGHDPADPVSMMYSFIFAKNDTFTIEIHSTVIGG